MFAVQDESVFERLSLMCSRSSVLLQICQCLILFLLLFLSDSESAGGHRHSGLVHRSDVGHRSAHPHPAHRLLHQEEQGREISR